MATIAERPRTVEAEINYLAPMETMPYFYAKDHDRDNLRARNPAGWRSPMRGRPIPWPSLDREGFTPRATQKRRDGFRGR